MRWTLLAAALPLCLIATGCATKKYTQETVAAEAGRLDTRIDDVEGQVEETQTRLDAQGRELRGEIGTVSKTAQDALARAEAAGKLAEGKFLFETVLTDDKVRFGLESSQLSDEAKAAIDEFASQLKAQNKNVYIEIQGHTDATGSEEYNERLGMERAEAVKRYLYEQHQVPLHKMNVISYGETKPVAGNKTRAERAQNRRVVVKVLAYRGRVIPAGAGRSAVRAPRCISARRSSLARRVRGTRIFPGGGTWVPPLFFLSRPGC
jgi:outer membrane protein OmpA-like peptidoglycan-associated protein